MNKIIQCDVTAGIPLEDQSVQMVMTSIPYWGLRSYNVLPSIIGGDPACEHEWGDKTKRSMEYVQGNSEYERPHREKKSFKNESQFCTKCNAWKGCLGLEPTPEMFVDNMVSIFREVKRVLRDDGILFINCGDSYAGGGIRPADNNIHKSEYIGSEKRRDNPVPTGLKPKDLCGIPERLVLALQADGWWWRSKIVWVKPNPMPGS